MKKTVTIIILTLSFAISFAQNDDFQDDYFREKVNLELFDNFSRCYPTETKKGLSNFNGVNEFWNICDLDNGNRIIRIESYRDDMLYQEIYFELNGKLRYVEQSEYLINKNKFSQMKLSYGYYFENEKLVTISFDNGNIKNGDYSGILKMYNIRLSELEKIEK